MTLKERKAYLWAARQRDSLVKSGWRIVGKSSTPIGWQLMNSSLSVIDIELINWEGDLIVYVVRDGKVKVSERF